VIPAPDEKVPALCVRGKEEVESEVVRFMAGRSRVRERWDRRGWWGGVEWDGASESKRLGNSQCSIQNITQHTITRQTVQQDRISAIQYKQLNLTLSKRDRVEWSWCWN
jgi:hypothetical protein